MRKNISVTNNRVLQALQESNNASRLIEEAILYYLDCVEEGLINRSAVKEIVYDCIRGMAITQPISNANYTESISSLDDDIQNILGL